MAAPRFRAGKRLWATEDDALLAARYPHERTSAIARDLGRSLVAVYARARNLGIEKTAAYLASPEACAFLRGGRSAAHRFPRGHVPANKGLRRPGWAPGRMKETQFKKGQCGWNWRPVGSRRLVDGYLYTKVSDRRGVPWTLNWRPTHVLRWERHRGPVPPGHALTFRNGDRRDVRLSNLKLISRRELMARNTVHNLPKPLKHAIQLLGALNRKIRRRTREEQDRRSA